MLPATSAAPSVVLCPLQILTLLPAFAAGSGFTVTLTIAVAWQPVAVIVCVRVYVDVVVLSAVRVHTGLETDAELKPVAGSHE